MLTMHGEEKRGGERTARYDGYDILCTQQSVPSGVELFAAIGIDFLHYPFVSLHFVVSFHSEINQQISSRHECGTLENIPKTINKSFVSIVARLPFQHIVFRALCVFQFIASCQQHRSRNIETDTTHTAYCSTNS